MPQQGIPERLGLPGGEPDGLEKATLLFGGSSTKASSAFDSRIPEGYRVLTTISRVRSASANAESNR
jgi:hypothetical protein